MLKDSVLGAGNHVKKLLPLLLFEGELRLRLTDAAGLGAKTSVNILSEAIQYRALPETNSSGELDVQILPYGMDIGNIIQLKLPTEAQRHEMVQHSIVLHTLKPIQFGDK